MSGRLAGKRVLLTQADRFMGPITAEVFAEEGAAVVADTRDLTRPGAAEEAAAAAGWIDVLVANLAGPTFSGIAATELGDDDWQAAFAAMVHPLHALVRAVLPQMIERRAGKIVVYGSAAALRGMKTLAAYSAARAAQLGYVQSVGVEVAPHNVQVNLIAQNYVENEDYYPAALQAKESFAKSLRRQVPAGRLAKPREDAMFALFLASDECGFICGQGIPFAGGWVQ
ncbi:MAG: SDR family oxidoreductase [Gammaproteobacteria bacterium]|nr:SDR family oxidoreductase [Gammaproteobacteria bacterium]MCP5200320.1 SDR family oxidoreductase [Gammaproteobacteria bacterium]